MPKYRKKPVEIDAVQLTPETGRDCPHHAPVAPPTNRAAHREAGTEAPAVPVHACPGPDDAGRMPCCGRPPHETLAHRITVHTHHVTCTGPTK